MLDSRRGLPPAPGADSKTHLESRCCAILIYNLRVTGFCSCYVYRKKEDKLEWMYAGATVNKEEYLLGRKIDHHVEKEEVDELKVFFLGVVFVVLVLRPHVRETCVSPCLVA